MITRRIGKFLLPPGPILSLTLVGLLLLSAILYYQAVRVQRFLEPALAISQPRMLFTRDMNEIIAAKLPPSLSEGVRFRSGSVFIRRSIASPPDGPARGGDHPALRPLAAVFLEALRNPGTREHISLILVGERLPAGADPETDRRLRPLLQERADSMLTSLFTDEPDLEKHYRAYFAATVLPARSADEADWIEFRIVPTEQLHIEVLKRLGKYVL